MRAFSGSLSAFTIAGCLAWLYRDSLVQLWGRPVLAVWSTHWHPIEPVPGGVYNASPTAALLTAVLMALPVFYIESWLFICRVARRQSARRFTLPFGFVSTCTTALAIWLAQLVGARCMFTSLQ